MNDVLNNVVAALDKTVQSLCTQQTDGSNNNNEKKNHKTATTRRMDG